MDEDQEILWEGEISQSYKTKENIAKMVLISLGSVAELITFFLYLENFNKITEAWIHTGIYFLLVLIPIGIILVIYATISTTAKNLFPKYLVTSDRLILKKWSFWRKLKIKTFNLSEINTIYIGEDIYSEKDSFWFYKKTADEILNECPQDMFDEISRLLKRQDIVPLDCFFGFDFEFMMVNTPIQLLKILESLIPLKQHPKYKAIFQRIK